MLAVTIMIIPATGIVYSLFHVRLVAGGDPQASEFNPVQQTSELPLLLAALAALGFVIATIPVVMQVAEGKEWALKVASAIGLSVELMALIVSIVLLAIPVLTVLNAFGVKLFGQIYGDNLILPSILALCGSGVAWLASRAGARTRSLIEIAQNAHN